LLPELLDEVLIRADDCAIDERRVDGAKIFGRPRGYVRPKQGLSLA
jgi:hypothetical protein